MPYKQGYGSLATFGTSGSDYMPEWFTGSTMNYSGPQLVSDASKSFSPYRESFGGYGLNQAGDLSTANPQYASSINNQGMSALDKMSAIGQGVQAFATLAGLYTGFKGLQMQKKQFNFAKSAWNKNFSAQLGAYDNALRDNYEKYRQGNSYFGNSYQSEDDYMSQRSLSHLVG
jgi:hypothetical protein